MNVLEIRPRCTARDLVVAHGCVRLEEQVKRALATYKERFVRTLPAERRGSCDFGRPVFTAAAFALVARKSRVKVDRRKLCTGCGVSEAELNSVCASMLELCFDTLGTSKDSKKPDGDGNCRATPRCFIRAFALDSRSLEPSSHCTTNTGSSWQRNWRRMRRRAGAAGRGRQAR